MSARPDPPHPVFFSYAHAGDGDFDDTSNTAYHRFFEDIGKMLYHLTTFSMDVAFADVSLRTGDVFQDVLFERLAQFQVFVPVLSLRYFESKWCGREWAAFEKRCEKPGTSMYPPIVPILWNGLADLSLPKWFMEQQLINDSTQDPLYRQHGLFGLQLLHRDHYLGMVYDLARRIGSVSKSTRIPECDPEELRILPPRFGGSE